MTKYQQYFSLMLVENKDAFESFKPIHDQYALDPKTYQEKFNKAGAPIMDILHEWENRLCAQSERSQYGKFSNTLSEKFWAQVRTYYPQIDWVGVTISWVYL